MKRQGPPDGVVLQGNVPTRAPGSPKVTRTHVYWDTALSLSRPAEAPLLPGQVSGATLLGGRRGSPLAGAGDNQEKPVQRQDSLLGPPLNKNAKACIPQTPLWPALRPWVHHRAHPPET